MGHDVGGNHQRSPGTYLGAFAGAGFPEEEASGLLAEFAAGCRQKPRLLSISLSMMAQ
jgi:hypothetical protein